METNTVDCIHDCSKPHPPEYFFGGMRALSYCNGKLIRATSSTKVRVGSKIIEFLLGKNEVINGLANGRTFMTEVKVNRYLHDKHIIQLNMILRHLVLKIQP